MTNSFGYSISKSRETDLDKANLYFTEQLLELEPSLRLCIGCGACTGTCMAASRSTLNIRKTHTRFRRGETASLAADLKNCMFCGKCTMVCPRGVNIRNVIDIMVKLIES